MKLDVRSAAVAAGSVAAMAYALCTLFCVLILPRQKSRVNMTENGIDVSMKLA